MTWTILYHRGWFSWFSRSIGEGFSTTMQFILWIPFCKWTFEAMIVFFFRVFWCDSEESVACASLIFSMVPLGLPTTGIIKCDAFWGDQTWCRCLAILRDFHLKIVRCLEGWKCFMTEWSPCDTPNFPEEITDRNPRKKPAQMLHGTGIILTYNL